MHTHVSALTVEDIVDARVVYFLHARPDPGACARPLILWDVARAKVCRDGSEQREQHYELVAGTRRRQSRARKGRRGKEAKHVGAGVDAGARGSRARAVRRPRPAELTPKLTSVICQLRASSGPPPCQGEGTLGGQLKPLHLGEQAGRGGQPLPCSRWSPRPRLARAWRGFRELHRL